jgi:type IV pilus modification protein PilV
VRPVRHKLGFSLIEVLCAILILGVGMVGLTYGLTTGLRSSKDSEIQTAAALLAANRIELLRADGFLITGSEDGEEEQGSARFRWEQRIASTSLAGLHHVTVVVQNAQSGQPVYELQTLLFDPPLESVSSENDKRKDSRGRERRRQ